MRLTKGLAGAAVVGPSLALLGPSVAQAHGLVGKSDLPIPSWLFSWAASVVLVGSFVALATLWPKTKFQQPQERKLVDLPRFVSPLAGAVGVFFFLFLIYAGFVGNQEEPVLNLMPNWVYVFFWVGLAFVSVVFGNVFKAFNPWLSFARFVAWTAKRYRPALVAGKRHEYPQRWGQWPAALGLLAFAWLELAYSGRDDPSTLAMLACLYALVQFAGMFRFGIETWSSRADPFGVYFGLIGRLAPLNWRDGALYVRKPGTGTVRLEVLPGTVAVLMVMIGSTSFDGFSAGDGWTGEAGIGTGIQNLLGDIGIGTTLSREIANTFGLLAMVGLIALVYRIGVRGIASVAKGKSESEVSAKFVHTLIPIAFAYVLAHYFSLVAFQGQSLGYLISDPLGNGGSDFFGTAKSTIDYSAVAANTTWYVQVFALVVGHVGALALAHDRSLALFKSAKTATRSQYWMLAVMVGYTSLGLWILSSTG